MRSDDSGTSFTELIISNTRLEPDEKPANVVRTTKTSQLNICNTIRQTVEESMDELFGRFEVQQEENLCAVGQ